MKRLQLVVARAARAARRFLVIGFRRVPGFRGVEQRWLLAAEGALHRQRPVAQGRLPGWCLDVVTVRQAVEAASVYRLIDQDALGPDERQVLHGLGINPNHLSAQRADRRLKAAGSSEALLPPQIFDTGYQRKALVAGELAFASPFTGQYLTSRHSLLVAPGAPVFYRFAEDGHVFYVAVGRESLGYQPVYLYLPEARLVILLGCRDWAWLGRWELDQLRAFMVVHRRAVASYLNRAPDKGQRVALVDHHHFAHNLWNSLSGVQALVNGGNADLPFDLLVATAEPMGPIDELFPEAPATKVLPLADAELPLRILQDGWFVVRAGGLVVDDELVARLRRVARHHVPQAVVDLVEDLTQQHWPVLWVTVRTGTRTWISQIDGLATLVNELHRRHPGMALVVDGLAQPWLRRTSDRFPWMDAVREAERALLCQIRSRLNSGIRLVELAGEPIFYSVVVAQAADVYVATHGALQNKIGWLARPEVPGVVHGSEQALMGINAPVEQYCGFWSRRGGAAPRYLHPTQVRDVQVVAGTTERRWAHTINHYEVDGRALLDAVDGLLALRCAQPTPGA